MSLANIKIGTKLVVGFVVVALVSLIIGIVGIVNMGKLNDAANNRRI